MQKINQLFYKKYWFNRLGIINLYDKVMNRVVNE